MSFRFIREARTDTIRFMFIRQAPDWPHWRVDPEAVQPALSAARLAQGRMLGMAQTLHLTERGALDAECWSNEAMATARIEGEELALESVRASAARRLGLAGAHARRRDDRTEATLDVLEAATANLDAPLDAERLGHWHAALFPTGRSGARPITTGRWRTHAEPMQIVTPRIGAPDIVHYEAPPSDGVDAEMARWLDAFNAPSTTDALVRAALTHAWFEAIHPFEDGNGRIGRALAERLIARDQPGCARLFSLSESLWQHRRAYYAALQATTGQPDMDATRWVIWFLNRLQEAFEESSRRMQAAVTRQRFQRGLDEGHPGLTPTQRKVLLRLFEAGPGEFKTGMSTQACVSLTRASRATAWRELNDLAARGLLQVTGRGRATRYHLVAGMAAPAGLGSAQPDGLQAPSGSRPGSA